VAGRSMTPVEGGWAFWGGDVELGLVKFGLAFGVGAGSSGQVGVGVGVRSSRAGRSRQAGERRRQFGMRGGKFSSVRTLNQGDRQ
jgi:hypothetical protein